MTLIRYVMMIEIPKFVYVIARYDQTAKKKLKT